MFRRSTFRRRTLRIRMRRRSDKAGGYILLLLMLAVAVLTITLLTVATNYRQSIRRDREVEMIHRGVQYERAVRLYYRKNGSYPPSIERLENTNKIRFLRKRYKDPMTPDGSWKIATLTDVNLPAVTGTPEPTGPVSPSSAGDESNRGMPRTDGGSGGQQGAGTGSAPPAPDGGAPPAADGGAPTIENRMPDEGAASGSPSNPNTGPVGSPSNPNPSENQPASPAAGNQTATVGTPGTVSTSSTEQTGKGTTGTPSAFGGSGVLGGGAMIGVISKSKREGIHSFNEKSKYNEWLFIYVPSQDIAQPGHIPNGPYNPKLKATAVTGQGTPAATPGSNGSNPASPGMMSPGTLPPGTATPGR